MGELSPQNSKESSVKFNGIELILVYWFPVRIIVEFIQLLLDFQ